MSHRNQVVLSETSERVAIDLSTKLNVLRASMSTRMRHVVSERRKQCCSTPSHLDEEALRHGVDVAVLRDLKEAYEAKNELGRKGVDESEFLRLFASSLCQGMSVEEVRVQYRSLDATCSGAISWAELSHYLVSDKTSSSRFCHGKYFGEEIIDPCGSLGTRQKKSHGAPIHVMAFAPSQDCFYTASQEAIFCWDATTLQLKCAEPVHKCEAQIRDVIFLAHSNRVLVLQSDRSIFVYDAYMHKEKLEHTLYRAFATEGKSEVRSPDGAAFYKFIHRKNEQGAHHDVHSQRVRDAGVFVDEFASMTPVSLLMASIDSIHCVDHLGGAYAGEPILCGLESGKLEIYTLLVGSSKPLKPSLSIQVHSAWVAAVRFVSDIGCAISCSLDETVCVTDIEKGTKLRSLSLPSHRRPVFSFAYDPRNHFIVTCGGKCVHVWNALTGALLCSLHDHEVNVATVAVNSDKQVVFSLMENKTIKVWDLQSWRCVGVWQDKVHRFPCNTLSFLYWCPQHLLLVVASTELLALRPREVQERLDAGLLPLEEGVQGHLHPIIRGLVLPECSHVVSMDESKVVVWSSRSRKFLASWQWEDDDDQVTATAMFLDGKRLLVGTEHGHVRCFNYVCGVRLATLRHNEKNSEIVFVAVVKGASDAATSMAMAGCRNSLFAWPVEAIHFASVVQPHAVFRVEPCEGTLTAFAMVDEERQIILISTSSSYHILLTINFALLHKLHFNGTPCESVLSLGASIFGSLHLDGVFRVFGVCSQNYDIIPLLSLEASHHRDSSLTCVASSQPFLCFGDGDGVVSVFQCEKLFDNNFLRTRVIPEILHGDERTALECCQAVRLVRAFEAHAGLVVTAGISDGTLITCGSDRCIRSWALHDFQCVGECGGSASSPFAAKDVSALHCWQQCSKIRHQANVLPPILTKLSFANGLVVRTPAQREVVSRNSCGKPPLAPGSRVLSRQLSQPKLALVPYRAPATPVLFNVATDRTAKICRLNRDLPLPRVIREHIGEVNRIRDQRSSNKPTVEEGRTFVRLVLPPIAKVETLLRGTE